MPIAHPSKLQNITCNTSLQPQNPNLSLSEKKKKVFFPGNSHSKNRSRGESPFGLFLSDRYLLNGLIKKKTKIKKPPETFYGVAFLILKMAQIRSPRKKNFFGHFSGRPKFYKKSRLGSSYAVWMFILPNVHPFLRLNLSYDTSPEPEIHNLEDWLLKLEKFCLIRKQSSFKIAELAFSGWKKVKNQNFGHILWKIGTFEIAKKECILCKINTAF